MDLGAWPDGLRATRDAPAIGASLPFLLTSLAWGGPHHLRQTPDERRAPETPRCVIAGRPVRWQGAIEGHGGGGGVRTAGPDHAHGAAGVSLPALPGPDGCVYGLNELKPRGQPSLPM